MCILKTGISCLFPSFLQPSSVSKPKTKDDDTEHQDSNLLERMIETLHMELLFVRHRVAVKLANLGQGEAISIHISFHEGFKIGRDFRVHWEIKSFQIDA